MLVDIEECQACAFEFLLCQVGIQNVGRTHTNLVTALGIGIANTQCPAGNT